MKYFIKSFVVVYFCFFAGMSYAQNNNTTTVSANTDPKTGIRVTTKITPLPTLSEQVANLEQKLAAAAAEPQLLQNGTADKYRAALAEKRRELAEEEAERQRIANENK